MTPTSELGLFLVVEMTGMDLSYADHFSDHIVPMGNQATFGWFASQLSLYYQDLIFKMSL